MRPRFSIVTISFNQAQFIGRTIDSVLNQSESSYEYIVCDPGSTDGSRSIIDSYGERIHNRIYEKDDGPADGLRKGFESASGEIFYYLNSDDTLLPGTLVRVDAFFKKNPEVDVVFGHGLVIDANDKVLRRVWSEPFSPPAVAHGAHVQIQPATFFRAEAFRRAGGFDTTNRATWDLGLLIRLYKSGAKMRTMNAFLATYRLHGASITASAKLIEVERNQSKLNFRELMGRDRRPSDRYIATALRLGKHIRWPMRALERLRRGPLFGREA